MMEVEIMKLKATSFVNHDKKKNISILDNVLKIQTDYHKPTCIS